MKTLYLQLTWLFICIGGFYLPNCAYTQTRLGDTTFYQLTIEDLTESTTVASNVITESDKQPVSITTITREQLQMSGARLLSEAIMIYVPGFFFVEDQDDQIAAFRGLAADNNSKVLLLIDGQNLNTEFFWGPADAILNSTNFSYIEKVEVIRGPGSVTLGQGALLGVINIVTRNPSNLKGSQLVASEIQFNAGPDNTLHGSADMLLKSKQLQGYFYISTNRYDGQPMRNEGWIAQQDNEGYAGGKVVDMGHRLHRTDNITFTGNISYKGFDLNVIYADQMKDLYNFYRDREVFQQEITSISASYTHKFSKNILWKNTVNYAQDHFSLSSLTGTIMGGTREDRLGLKSLLTLNNLIPRNKLAIGVEGRQFKMGLSNMLGNNFIANVIGSFDPTTANQELSMGFRRDITVLSVFFEDLYSVNESLEFFLGFRSDSHPFWGLSFTPRLGLFYSPADALRLRLSYQSGFRGAVGLHYTGGYRRDGFLRASNYNEVDESSIPVIGSSANAVEADIPTTQPERMNSFELSADYRPNKALSLNLVGFYNAIQNVIDVGVIYRDPQQFEMVGVGSDIPGDWNGYWFFKNTPGNFTQVGAEFTASYKAFDWEIGFSQSLTRVAQATTTQRELAASGSSMYLASSDDGSLHFKAYPESVTRLYAIAKPIEGLSISANAMGYSSWYSPSGAQANGGIVVNASAFFQFTPNISFGLTGRNLTGEDALYPMNSNAGGPDVSPGTPAWESTSFWATLRLSFE